MTSRILLMAALALAACSKSSESESKSSKVTEPATATPKAARPEPKPATAADFGKVPAPFGMLAKLKIGMTEAEAKAAAPQFWDKKGESRLVDTDWQDLHYSISFVDGRLNHFGLSNLGKTDLRGLLKQAWGPGIEAKNDIDYPYTVWFDAQTRWRAIVEARDGGGLELTQYLPIEALLGPDPVELAVFPKPMLGASPAELQASYPDLFQHKTKEQLDAASRTAEAQAKQLGTDVKLGSASTDLRRRHDARPDEVEVGRAEGQEDLQGEADLPPEAAGDRRRARRDRPRLGDHLRREARRRAVISRTGCPARAAARSSS
jgi:hypothetical protein